jgi:hypothetical protein
MLFKEVPAIYSILSEKSPTGKVGIPKIHLPFG